MHVIAFSKEDIKPCKVIHENQESKGGKQGCKEKMGGRESRPRMRFKGGKA